MPYAKAILCSCKFMFNFFLKRALKSYFATGVGYMWGIILFTCLNICENLYSFSCRKKGSMPILKQFLALVNFKLCLEKLFFMCEEKLVLNEERHFLSLC